MGLKSPGAARDLRVPWGEAAGLYRSSAVSGGGEAVPLIVDGTSGPPQARIPASDFPSPEGHRRSPTGTARTAAGVDLDISVVIVSWNTRKLLLDCLTSLEAHPVRRSMEIIVVDNDSGDGSAEAVEQSFPAVNLVRSGSNLGFGRGCNLGIDHARGRYVCIVNSDVVFLDACLDQLCDFLDREKDVGIAGPRLLWPDHTLQLSCRRFPSLWIHLCGALGLSRIFPKSRLFGTEHMGFFAHDRQIDVDALAGPVLAIRREALEQAGTFDERFFMYCEEVDLCKRIGDAGWRIVFQPEARAVHVARASSSREPGRFLLARIQSQIDYWAKHYGEGPTRWLARILGFGHALRYVGTAIASALQPGRRAEYRASGKNHLDALRLTRRLARAVAAESLTVPIEPCRPDPEA